MTSIPRGVDHTDDNMLYITVTNTTTTTTTTNNSCRR
jgi:hypothetical protein